ncbi:MAG: phosphoribosylformylglycinamidine cyclo-ligase [Planctomycetota bacterium]
MNQDAFQYDEVGVDTERAQTGLGRLARSINQTLTLRDGSDFGRPAMGLGYFANVLELPGRQGLAICTDGVGTKILIADALGRYDTIPIDMIAMNVNDILCVGAEPFALVDYIAVGNIDDEVFDQLGRGLLEGARQSKISIPGGEIAQVKELLQSHGASKGLDLVGTAVGLVAWDQINWGQAVRSQDVVIGIASSGLHSNGFTLARHILLEKGGLDLRAVPSGLKRTLGDALLEPTRIYVAPIMALRDAGIPLNALVHLTGDGYCNLNRIRADVGFVIDRLPEPGAIFGLIQETGGIEDAEMFSVFNMGIGFCAVIPKDRVEDALGLIEKTGAKAQVIGYATDEHKKEVRLPQYGLVGGKDRLHRS